jgi:predicted Fe-Mo cluster-binding NifX family protein
MKICITSQGDNLESQVDPRFGRCRYFIIVDPETMEFEAIKNPNTDAFGGAGTDSAQLIASKGVEVVLTGDVGPNASRALESAGIKIVTGIAGSIKDAIEKYKKGDD